jgi:predicted nucleic acid-binding protein
MRNILFDTGAFVALIDKSENNHGRCVEFFREFKGKLLATEPVLTEALYLLNSSIKAQRWVKDGDVGANATSSRLIEMSSSLTFQLLWSPTKP